MKKINLLLSFFLSFALFQANNLRGAQGIFGDNGFRDQIREYERVYTNEFEALTAADPELPKVKRELHGILDGIAKAGINHSSEIAISRPARVFFSTKGIVGTGTTADKTPFYPPNQIAADSIQAVKYFTQAIKDKKNKIGPIDGGGGDGGSSSSGVTLGDVSVYSARIAQLEEDLAKAKAAHTVSPSISAEKEKEIQDLKDELKKARDAAAAARAATPGTEEQAKLLAKAEAEKKELQRQLDELKARLAAGGKIVAPTTAFDLKELIEEIADIDVRVDAANLNSIIIKALKGAIYEPFTDKINQLKKYSQDEVKEAVDAKDNKGLLDKVGSRIKILLKIASGMEDLGKGGARAGAGSALLKQRPERIFQDYLERLKIDKESEVAKKKRAIQNLKADFNFILGSATNPPTAIKEGFENALKAISSKRESLEYWKTEFINDIKQSIKFLAETESELNKLDPSLQTVPPGLSKKLQGLFDLYTYFRSRLDNETLKDMRNSLPLFENYRDKKRSGRVFEAIEPEEEPTASGEIPPPPS